MAVGEERDDSRDVARRTSRHPCCATHGRDETLAIVSKLKKRRLLLSVDCGASDGRACLPFVAPQPRLEVP